MSLTIWRIQYTGVFNIFSMDGVPSFVYWSSASICRCHCKHRWSRCSSGVIMSTWSGGYLKSGRWRNLPLFWGRHKWLKLYWDGGKAVEDWETSSPVYSMVLDLNLYQPQFYIKFAHLAHACVHFLGTKIVLCIGIWAPLPRSWKNNLRCHLLQDWFCDL